MAKYDKKSKEEVGKAMHEHKHEDKYQSSKQAVPAGRCTPPGDPREATVDCALKNYDHKFNQ
jgi:hypothetical protein